MRLHRDNMDQLRKPPEVSRRSYFQVSNRFAASVVLGTALAFGTVGATSAILLTPRAAMAQDEVVLSGLKLGVFEMGEKVQTLIRLNKAYQTTEFRSPDGSNCFGVTSGDFSTLFIISPDAEGRAEGHISKLHTQIHRGVGFQRFREAVEKHTGEKVEKILTLIEVYTDPNSGDVMKIGYGFFLDRNGEMINYRGGYLGVAMAYSERPGTFDIATGIIVQPGDRLAQR